MLQTKVMKRHQPSRMNNYQESIQSHSFFSSQVHPQNIIIESQSTRVIQVRWYHICFILFVGDCFKIRKLLQNRQICLQSILQLMKVLGCIGAGSFGKVYKVEVDGELFAVKKINLEFDCEEDCWEMQQARKQANILSECLYHPNIVRQGDHFCIAMEYVQGQPLNNLQFPFQKQERIVDFIIQILLALRHLKKISIIHRDLKPSNILISEKGLFKIVDFGISKKLMNSQLAVSCLGTPYYTAPEILMGEKYDYQVDLWSLGVILYEICHGKLPFHGSSMEQLRKNIKEHYPGLRNDLHEDIKLIIRGCLSKDPSHRFKIEQILNLPLINSQMMRDIRGKGQKNMFDFN